MTHQPSRQSESVVAPIDELRILSRYAGSTNVSALYARMEELGRQLGYGKRYWDALRDADRA